MGSSDSLSWNCFSWSQPGPSSQSVFTDSSSFWMGCQLDCLTQNNASNNLGVLSFWFQWLNSAQRFSIPYRYLVSSRVQPWSLWSNLEATIVINSQNSGKYLSSAKIGVMQTEVPVMEWSVFWGEILASWRRGTSLSVSSPFQWVGRPQWHMLQMKHHKIHIGCKKSPLPPLVWYNIAELRSSVLPASLRSTSATLITNQ